MGAEMGKQPGFQVLSHPAADWARFNSAMFFASGAASVEELLQQLSRGARVLAQRARATDECGRVLTAATPGFRRAVAFKGVASAAPSLQ